LCGLSLKKDPNLLIGIDSSEDAGVYKLTEEIALVQTIDFFTPMIDDPYDFGQIAAANSLSDVYATGGKPLTAMNMIGFPVNDLDLSVLQRIINGGLEKIYESGAVLVGGHSVDDQELKYGLSVTGIVHPNKIWSNVGARQGDKILLTKPIGLGVFNTAIKADMASDEEVKSAVRIMAHLNRVSSEVMAQSGGVHACTDVTGFGLIGHLYNICKYSNVRIRLNTENIPIIKGAENYCKMGLLPAGAYLNRKFYESRIKASSNISDLLLDLFYDPQTSGGLLAFIDPEKIDPLLDDLAEKGESWCRVIGEVSGPGEGLFLE
jgi:selenide,water dikinase